MSDYTDIKRNHFRFPAFSDEEGVKIQDGTFRKPFSYEDDWILTDEDIDRKANRMKDSYTSRRGNKSVAHKAGHSVQQMEELKKHRENLPTYSRHAKVEVSPTGRKNLFGSSHLHATYKVKNQNDSTKEQSKNSYCSDVHQKAVFKPKYIPASLIKDQPKEAVEQSDLLDAMQKSKESYLLFDTELAPYQIKHEESEPTVRKFKVPQGEKAQPELTKAPQAAINRKKSVLGSLDAMIEDGQHEKRNTKYFN
ncbi:MAG TPA: hypothetical protein K8W13_03900 [Enterococcus columbae]|nr:hypothetical protein [Enterococcus columbae]